MPPSPSIAIAGEAAEPLPVYRIAPARTWVPIDLKELWDYRELLYFLVWREVKVRYKQTALGVAWAVLQPVLTMLIFTFVFGYLAKLPSDGAPYPVFTYAALLPWQLFAFALTESSTSVVTNQRLVTKVYFPRLIMPIAAIGVGLVDFAVSFVVLVILMAYYRVSPGWAVLTLPLWIGLAILTALAVGLWLSALNVRYRDVRYTVPFLTQIWLFATPVAYSLYKIPVAWRRVYALNPMVGVVQAFRWALLGQGRSPWTSVAISTVAVLVTLIGGLAYFRRTERTFADVV
jgi:lipopolysaccharide transport system permease protein